MRTRVLTLIATMLAAILLPASLAAAADPARQIPGTGWSWANATPWGADLYAVHMKGGAGWIGGNSLVALRTEDGGASWRNVNVPFRGDQSNPNRVRMIDADSAVFSNSCDLFRTDDGGRSVHALAIPVNNQSCTDQIVGFSFGSESRGVIVISDGRVYGTDDGGASWVPRSPVPGSPAAGTGTTVPGQAIFADGNVGAVTAGDNIYYTSDGATSWQQGSRPGSGYIEWFHWIDTNTAIAVGSGSAVLFTEDGGATWTQSASTPEGAATYRYAGCTSRQHCMITANGKGTYTTFDGGATWSPANGIPTTVTSAVPASSTRAVAAGYGSFLATSDDGGLNWSTASTAPGAFSGLRLVSSREAYVFGNGNLAHSSDGGASWQPFDVGPATTVVDVAFADPTFGYVATGARTLIRMVRDPIRGEWDRQTVTLSCQPRSIGMRRVGRIVVVCKDGAYEYEVHPGRFGLGARRRVTGRNAIRFDSGGSAFAVVNERSLVVAESSNGRWQRWRVPRAKISRFDLIDERAAVIGTANGTILTTSDRGRHWRESKSAAVEKGALLDISFGSRKRGYIATRRRLLVTGDGGKSWSVQRIDVTRATNLIPLRIGAYREHAVALPGGGTILFSDAAGALGAPSRIALERVRRKGSTRISSVVRGKVTPVPVGGHVELCWRTSSRRSSTVWKCDFDFDLGATGKFAISIGSRAAVDVVARWAGDGVVDGAGTHLTKYRAIR